MHYFTHVTGIRETDKGTDLIIHVPDERLSRQIRKYAQAGVIDAELKINDGRKITPDQNRKIHALIRDIAMYTGDIADYKQRIPDDLKKSLKEAYCKETSESYFSTSSCSISLASDFISFIIDFILEWNIPLADEAWKYTDNIDRYLYGCIKHRRCAITGKANADIHHITGSKVGMGRDRRTINHKGLKLIALDREWHRKVEQEGEQETFDKHRIYGITVSDETLKELNLNYEDIT